MSKIPGDSHRIRTKLTTVGRDQRTYMLNIQHAQSRYDTTEVESSHPREGLTLLRLVIVVVLAITIIKLLLGLDQTITFKGLLDFISEVPQVDIKSFIVFDDLRITADWGIFNFLRSFINFFTLPLGVVVFLAGGIYQVIVFLIYFIQFIF